MDSYNVSLLLLLFIIFIVYDLLTVISNYINRSVDSMKFVSRLVNSSIDTCYQTV